MVESGLKNRVIIILTILCAILFLVAVGSCSNSRRQSLSREDERQKRFELEEKFSSFNEEKADLEEQLSVAKADLQDQETKYHELEDELTQEHQRTEELQEELEKISALKDAQEAGLKKKTSEKR